MKTHDFAKELTALAKALRAGPNIEIRELSNYFSGSMDSGKVEMAFGISTLTQLSTFTRQEWIQFIKEHRLPVDFGPRDSSRNIIGKIMSYLSEHEDALARVSKSIGDERTGSSKRLNMALRVLLKGD